MTRLNNRLFKPLYSILINISSKFLKHSKLLTIFLQSTELVITFQKDNEKSKSIKMMTKDKQKVKINKWKIKENKVMKMKNWKKKPD